MNWYPDNKIKTKLVPVPDSQIMRWWVFSTLSTQPSTLTSFIMHRFRNIPAGEPFDQGAVSADYSLQLMIGWENYHEWLNVHKHPGRRVRPPMVKEQVAPRTGPLIQYD